MKTSAVIVAVAKNGIIGNNNELPWKLSADLKWFKRVTTGHSIIMGRRTWLSIGHPLPGRENIVLSRRPDLKIDGCIVQRDLETAIQSASSDKVFVIGGAQIYRMAMPLVDELYLTVVAANVEGDTWFPFVDLSDWELKSTESHDQDERNQFDCEFRMYRRLARIA